jgi:hypothetical protein
MDVNHPHRSTLDRWKDLADRPFFVPMVAFDLVILAGVQELPGMSRDVCLPTHSPPAVLDELASIAAAVRMAVSHRRSRHTNTHTLAPLLARECPHPDLGVFLPEFWHHVARYILAFTLTPSRRRARATGDAVTLKVWDGAQVIIPPPWTTTTDSLPGVWADIYPLSQEEFTLLFEINDCLSYSTYAGKDTPGQPERRLCVGPLALCIASCQEHGGSVDVATASTGSVVWCLRAPAQRGGSDADCSTTLVDNGPPAQQASLSDLPERASTPALRQLSIT